MGFYSAQSTQLASGTALKTYLQIVAAATIDVTIREIYAGQKRAPSNTADLPVLMTVMRQTSAGTTGGGAGTIRELGPQSGRTPNFTTQIGPAAAWAVEPTASDELLHRFFPVANGYTWQGYIFVPRNTRLGICLTSTTDITCLVEAIVEEN